MSVVTKRVLMSCPVCKAYLQAVAERPLIRSEAKLLSVRCGVCTAEVWPPPDEPLAGSGEIRLEISAEESEEFAAEARREFRIDPRGSGSETS